MLTCTRYDHHNNVLANINNDLQQIGNNDYTVLFWNPLFISLLCFLFWFGFVCVMFYHDHNLLFSVVMEAED